MKRILMRIINISISVVFLLGLVVSPAAAAAPLYGVVEQSVLSPCPESLGARFGEVLAMSGDTVVIGAPFEDGSLGKGVLRNSGAVYVYLLGKDGAWEQQARIVSNDPREEDLFGVSVALEDDTLVVGASGRDWDDDEDVGVVYIFEREGADWHQQARIEPTSSKPEDAFGSVVSLSGNRIAISALGADLGLLPDVGQVFLYTRSGDKWYHVNTLWPSAPVPLANYGQSLQMTGTRLLVGAPSDTSAGTVYIYNHATGTWLEEARLHANDGRQNDSFGTSLAIHGDMVVVGAPSSDPDLGFGRVTNAGAAYVFKSKSSGWQQTAQITRQDGRAFDHFGQSVAVEEKFIVVGADGEDNYDSYRAGAAYLYLRDGGEWNPQTRMVPLVSIEDGGFGAAVALSGSRIVVGGAGTSTRTQPSYVYKVVEGLLPAAGFASDVRTTLPDVQTTAYADLGALWLEIPDLAVASPIVGVPRTGNQWDVRWLGADIGYLDGTAFPTLTGNTVLTGHVVAANGYAGPFAGLGRLGWGDRIVVHFNGAAHVYEVREVFSTTPNDMRALESLPGHDWLTLITCQDYDPASDSYNTRLVVRAVRIK